jgi:hypothetical protein
MLGLMSAWTQITLGREDISGTSLVQLVCTGPFGSVGVSGCTGLMDLLSSGVSFYAKFC